MQSEVSDEHHFMVFHVFAVKFTLFMGVSRGQVYIMAIATSSFGRGYPGRRSVRA